MSNLDDMLMESKQCFEKAVAESSIKPVLDSLRSIKSTFKASGFASPKDFIETKGLKLASDYAIDRRLYEGNESIALSFRDESCKDQVAEIARKSFAEKVLVDGADRFYLDVDNNPETDRYFIGIFID